jgi:hypothetical protein
MSYLTLSAVNNWSILMVADSPGAMSRNAGWKKEGLRVPGGSAGAHGGGCGGSLEASSL